MRYSTGNVVYLVMHQSEQCRRRVVVVAGHDPLADTGI